MRITIARRGSTLWEACGDLARTRYVRDYQARIEPSPDSYVALSPDGSSETAPVACAGLTYGGSRPLFIENYFGASAADTLTGRTGTACEPTALVEIGPLASVEPGAGLALVRMLPAFCWCNGAEFIMCTITRRLAALLARIGIRFTPVTQAREDQLPQEQQGRWGTYYDTDPMAGYVDVRHFGAEISERAELGYHLAVTWHRPAALAETAGVR
ncbi:thermostable hemolysin [Streptomyces fulvoviolaceus]|uniref:thermostable hemolysin n=1 Tax=Streptomyces fulvoviolaceus TaxID=285535 RepID=UPI0004CBB32A|nr:thermostable hemolysin [Streptomyces fulvoviolaceus]MCT9080065.1 thermostable hemolysin [Streptomyces fulvoviolaceus]